MYFNTFIINEIYADVSQNAIIGSMEDITVIARMVALSGLYLLIRKGFDLKENNTQTAEKIA